MISWSWGRVPSPPFPPFSLPHLKNTQSNINFTIVGQHSVHTFVSANHLIIAFFNPSEYLNIFDIHHSKHLECCNTVLLNEFQKKKLMMTFRAGGVNHISFLCFALQCTIRNVQHFTTPVFMCSLNILLYHVFVVVTLMVCIRLLKILLTKVHNTYNWPRKNSLTCDTVKIYLINMKILVPFLVWPVLMEVQPPVDQESLPGIQPTVFHNNWTRTKKIETII